MRMLEPKRGKYYLAFMYSRHLTILTAPDTIDNWRADSKRVLQEPPELAEQRIESNEQINVEISTLLRALLQFSPDVVWDAEACKGLVLMARKFKDTIDVSPKTYICEYDFQPGDTQAVRSLYEVDFDKYDVIDARTDAKVRSKKKLRPDNTGCYGLKLCIIYPALRRVSTRDGRKVTLVKATILAELFK
jgi:hypothetical protein